MHGDPLLHPSALNALRTELFPLATLVTPNLDEVRLIVDIDVVDAAIQRDAARALHALGPQWALVKGGHLRSSTHSADLLFDGTDFYEFDADRASTPATTTARATPWPPRRQRAGARLLGARCGRLRQTVGHRMSARRIPVGPRPRPRLRAVQAGADGSRRRSRVSRTSRTATRSGAVVLTHGAGGNRESPLLIKLCDEWARRGWLAVRYDLPYRRRRPKGPPSGSAAADQAGIVGGRRAGPHADRRARSSRAATPTAAG